LDCRIDGAGDCRSEEVQDKIMPIHPLHNRNLSAGYECDQAVGIYSYSPQVIQSMVEAWVSLLKNHDGSQGSAATVIEEFLPQVEYHSGSKGKLLIY